MTSKEEEEISFLQKRVVLSFSSVQDIALSDGYFTGLHFGERGLPGTQSHSRKKKSCPSGWKQHTSLVLFMGHTKKTGWKCRCARAGEDTKGPVEFLATSCLSLI